MRALASRHIATPEACRDFWMLASRAPVDLLEREAVDVAVDRVARRVRRRIREARFPQTPERRVPVAPDRRPVRAGYDEPGRPAVAQEDGLCRDRPPAHGQ